MAYGNNLFCFVLGPNEVSVATAEAFLQVHGAKSWIKGASYSQTASGMSSSTETSLISLRDRTSPIYHTPASVLLT